MNPLTVAAVLAMIAPPVAAAAEELPLIPMPRSVELSAENPVWPSDTVPRVTVSPLSAPLQGRPEGYLLAVTPSGITIEAADSAGALWATQTLRQLRRHDGSYPQVRIADWPEFPIRDFMYDERARHTRGSTTGSSSGPAATRGDFIPTTRSATS